MSSGGLGQFQHVFIEESLEGLDTMESSLLALDEGGDGELVHTIFRAAHSIKGGAATFGFPEMASFTHEAESLLDEVRGGKRAIDKPIIELLLRSVDCLRAMFARARAGVERMRRAGRDVELRSLPDHGHPVRGRLRAAYFAALRAELAAIAAD